MSLSERLIGLGEAFKTVEKGIPINSPVQPSETSPPITPSSVIPQTPEDTQEQNVDVNFHKGVIRPNLVDTIQRRRLLRQLADENFKKNIARLRRKPENLMALRIAMINQDLAFSRSINQHPNYFTTRLLYGN